MRPIRYNVAASLDGFIAGPNGEFDWIPHDPAVDFGSLLASLLAAGQVDRVEVTVVPVVLGEGVPLLAAGIPRTVLELVDTHTYPTGMVTLTYRAPSAKGGPA